MRERTFMRLMILPALLVFIFVGLYPSLEGLFNSFTNYRLTDIAPRSFAGLDNYITMFTEPRFWQALGRTLIFVGSSVFFTYLIGLIVSLMLTKTKGMRNLYRIIFLVPMIIAPTITALNFRFMYDYNFGIINALLEMVRLPTVDFLGNPSLALYSALLVDIWQGIPLAMLILLAGLEALPASLYEAAKIDGAGAWQRFRFVTMPLLKRFSVIVIILRTMDSLRVFETIQLLTGGGPGTSSETLNIYIATVGFSWFDMGYAAALGIFTLYFVMILASRVIKLTGIFRSEEGEAK